MCIVIVDNNAAQHSEWSIKTAAKNDICCIVCIYSLGLYIDRVAFGLIFCRYRNIGALREFLICAHCANAMYICEANVIFSIKFESCISLRII